MNWSRLILGFSVLTLVVGCRSAGKAQNAEQSQSQGQAAELVKELQSDDAVVALDAESKLRAEGKAALAALVAFAKASPAKGQRKAVRLIGAVGGKAAAQGLIEVLLEGGPHLKGEVITQLEGIGNKAVTPLVKAIPKADDTSLADIQTVLMLIGDKAVVDQVIYSVKQHLRSKAELSPETIQFRSNSTAVLRALTGHGFNFDKHAPNDKQRQVLEQWVDWWGKNRDVIDFMK